MLNRRQLMLLAGAAPAALAGCAEIPSLLGKLPQYAEDARNIGDVVDKIANDVEAVAGLPAEVKTAVQAGAAKVKAAADVLVAAVAGGGTAGLNLVGNFAAAVTSLAKIAGVSGGAANTVGKIGTALQMALQVLPSILGTFGVALAGPADGDVAAARAWLRAQRAA